MNEILAFSFALLFVSCVIYAMITDFTRLRIPDLVPFALTAAFPLYALAGGTPDFWTHLLMAGGVFVLFFVFFAMGWVAAGDVKFMGALMLWAGPVQGARFVTLAALLGAAFAMTLLLLRYSQLQYPILAKMPVLAKFSRWARNNICPYGLPIGIAALWVAPAIFASAFGLLH